jgi:hypothetical protein
VGTSHFACRGSRRFIATSTGGLKRNAATSATTVIRLVPVAPHLAQHPFRIERKGGVASQAMHDPHSQDAYELPAILPLVVPTEWVEAMQQALPLYTQPLRVDLAQGCLQAKYRPWIQVLRIHAKA